MMKNKILIGRNYDCDMRIDERFNMVSNHHAVISITPQGVVFEDVSTNGSTVNGIRVHHRAVIVQKGDVIVLAGQYQVRWEAIMPFLHTPTVVQETPNFNAANMNYTQPIMPSSPSSINGPETEKQDADNDIGIDKWNWGAFMFTWLWGVCNKVYWPLVVLIPILGWIAWPVIAIMLGIKGNRWSWENNCSSGSGMDAERFMQRQKTWSTVGLVVFCISIVSNITYALVFLGAVRF